MREQARQAGSTATMTRWQSVSAWTAMDDVRELYAAAVRDSGLGFAARPVQVISQKLKATRRWPPTC